MPPSAICDRTRTKAGNTQIHIVQELAFELTRQDIFAHSGRSRKVWMCTLLGLGELDRGVHRQVCDPVWDATFDDLYERSYD